MRNVSGHGRVIVVRGPIAVGKTTVVQLLAAQIARAAVVPIDWSATGSQLRIVGQRLYALCYALTALLLGDRLNLSHRRWLDKEEEIHWTDLLRTVVFDRIGVESHVSGGCTFLRGAEPVTPACAGAQVRAAALGAWMRIQVMRATSANRK